MSEMRTEEEQVQAIKEWWKENGKSLLLGIGVAVALILGWKAWQDRQAIDAENASVLYQNMVEATVSAVSALDKPETAADQLATAKHLASQLKSDYEDSTYAKYAALLQARIAADARDYDLALSELEWVLTRQPQEELRLVASVRKARLIAEKGDFDGAISLLNGLKAGRFTASVEEVKGDLYLAKGDKDNARQAYANAKAALKEGAARPLLTMKLDDLAVKDK